MIELVILYSDRHFKRLIQKKLNDVQWGFKYNGIMNVFHAGYVQMLYKNRGFKTFDSRPPAKHHYTWMLNIAHVNILKSWKRV